jgi:uncharacterized protein (TIGR03435 family)
MIGLAILAAAALPVRPQSPALEVAAFEVASIRPASPAAGWSGFQTPGGGAFNASRVTLKATIAFAYDVREFNMSGGPGWAGSDEFEILAKAEANTTREQMRVLLRSLLAERFKLTVPRETRELPVYELVLAKGGPKLQESSKGGGFIRFGGRGVIEAHGVSTTGLSQYLSTELERIVLDKAGLTADYDFTLSWIPDESLPEKLKLIETTQPDPNRPSLFTALEEQLGLKLEAAKAAVETVVIDRVEKPSGN